MKLEADNIVTEDGTTLRLWSCIPENAKSATLFVHGATYSGRAIFALETEGIDGYSWLRFAANEGYAAYAIDLRGYGGSDFPSEFNDSAESSAPPVSASTASGDVSTVLEHLNSEYDHLHLVGYSWGTIICGILATTNSELNIASLTQFAPIYDPSRAVGEKFKPSNPPEAYRHTSKDQISKLWNEQLPPDSPPQTHRGGTEETDPVLDAFWKTLYRSNQGTEHNGEEYILAPNGTLVDIYNAATDGPRYAAEDISVPTLIVRGTRDTISTRTDALSLYNSLSDTSRRFLEISGGTHFLPLEARRHALYESVTQFQQDSQNHGYSSTSA